MDERVFKNESRELSRSLSHLCAPLYRLPLCTGTERSVEFTTKGYETVSLLAEMVIEILLTHWQTTAILRNLL